ncbi:MAG: hypothetical protein ABEJ30_01535 [Halorientalis sp.]
MVWVKSEYAEELAVASAWVSALVPWSVSVAWGTIGSGTLIEVRFPFFLVRYLFGVEITGAFDANGIKVLTPPGAADFYAGAPSALPFWVWTAAAGVLGIAVLFSLALYAEEERLLEAPVDPVRVMGALLLVSAVLLSLSSWLLQFGRWPLGDTPTFPGVLFPVGVLFQFFFAYTLLAVERVDHVGGEAADGEAPDVATGRE